MCAFMELTLPFVVIMRNDMTVKGKRMYTEDNTRFMIQLAESGCLRLGRAGGIQTVGSFSLEQFEAALIRLPH